MSPSIIAVERDNTASFVKAPEDASPAEFAVMSGTQTKSLNQVIADDASLRFLTPGCGAAIGSPLVLCFTRLRGRRIVNHSLHHRLYQSMVSIYDMYSKDILKFRQEMENMLVERQNKRRTARAPKASKRFVTRAPR
jgi:hypothetical protein